MKLGILSGKGGTGKTTVSTNLALLTKTAYVDCDVEEPNGFLFLNPENIASEDVLIDYPIIDKDKCNLCGACADACQFNALATGKNSILLFDKLCHSCGVCELICKKVNNGHSALSYKKRKLGIIEKGNSKTIDCIRGLLNIGEPMAVPVLRQIFKQLDNDKDYIIDCCPGTSCNVVCSLTHIDKAILVTEPTELGLHDLKMARELVNQMNIPHGVIINKSLDHETKIEEYCNENNIPIVGKIPYDRKIAQSYSNGSLLIEQPSLKIIFEDILKQMKGADLWS